MIKSNTALNYPVRNFDYCQISNPLYLQAGAVPGDPNMVSLREHIGAIPNPNPHLPLILLTFHPGYLAGSYEDRDYFELITPLLFAASSDKYRLRIFTVNHPGTDLPANHEVGRFQTERYSIKKQPAMIIPALRWLLQQELADEKTINLLAYGHSMGGLALAQCDLQQLAQESAQQGRQIRIAKVLSAPALILRRDVRKTLRSLDLLHGLKNSVGRLPLYEKVVTSIYRTLAPIFHKLSATTYSLNPQDSFLNLKRQNPFLLLHQGRELLQQQLPQEKLVTLLAGSHLLVYGQDRMVDSPALLKAAGDAQQQGVSVQVHKIKSLHNAEREHPQAVAAELQQIMQELLAA